MANVAGSDLPTARRLVEEVGTAAARALGREVAPVADELKQDAAHAAKEAGLIGTAATLGFLCIQTALLGSVEALGIRVGRPKAAALVACMLGVGAAVALAAARRHRVTAPGRRLLERMAAAFRAPG